MTAKTSASSWQVLLLSADSRLRRSMARTISAITYDRLPVRAVHASDVAAAEQVVTAASNLAVVVIDTAGLDARALNFVKNLRGKYNNDKAQVILRLRDTGFVPSRGAIVKYDIHDYHTAATDSDKFFTAVFSAVKDYAHLKKFAELAGSVDRTIRRKTAKLANMAHLDFLTGACNRRFFTEQAHREIARIKRNGRALGFIMIDIDRFKRINDTYGHYAGDKALQHLVKICRDSLRTGDTLGRIGGEEFAILLADTTACGARIVAERISSGLRRQPLVFKGRELAFTISCGITALEGSHASLDRAYAEADKALYRAKNAGRNLIALA